MDQPASPCSEESSLGPPCYIDRLPNELLSDIFVIRKQDDDNDLFDSFIRRGDDGPVVIRLVSRRWNSVAIGTSILWTRLPISDRHGGIRALTWAKNSADRDLTFCITLEDCTLLSKAVGQLHSYFPRIKSLDIRRSSAWGPSTSELQTLFSSLPPSIQHARFYFAGFPDKASLVSFLQRYNQLQHLDISTCVWYEPYMDDDTLLSLSITRSDWITMPQLEELILPVNEMGLVMRRSMVAPRLSRTVLHCHRSDSTAVLRFYGSRAVCVKDVINYLHSVPVHLGHFLLLTPQVEELTLIYENREETANLEYYCKTACKDVLEGLTDGLFAFPLPDNSLAQWIQMKQVVLPRLRLLNMRILPTPQIDDDDNVLYSDLGDLLVARQCMSDAGKAVPLEELRIKAPKEPQGWEEIEQELHVTATRVIPCFGPFP